MGSAEQTVDCGGAAPVLVPAGVGGRDMQEPRQTSCGVHRYTGPTQVHTPHTATDAHAHADMDALAGS